MGTYTHTGFDVNQAIIDLKHRMATLMNRLHKNKTSTPEEIKSIQTEYCYYVDELERGPIFFAKSVYSAALEFINRF